MGVRTRRPVECSGRGKTPREHPAGGGLTPRLLARDSWKGHGLEAEAWRGRLVRFASPEESAELTACGSCGRGDAAATF
jgi:hypothetical protein